MVDHPKPKVTVKWTSRTVDMMTGVVMGGVHDKAQIVWVYGGGIDLISPTLPDRVTIAIPTFPDLGIKKTSGEKLAYKYRRVDEWANNALNINP